MAVREILTMGNPLLYQRSEEITEFDTPELHALIKDMFDTMAANDGAGLAAPQIGVMKRLVLSSITICPKIRFGVTRQQQTKYQPRKLWDKFMRLQQI